jgi:hypothetical protein
MKKASIVSRSDGLDMALVVPQSVGPSQLSPEAALYARRGAIAFSGSAIVGSRAHSGNSMEGCPKKTVGHPTPPFSFDCPECGTRLESVGQLVGQIRECPKCQKSIVVPENGVVSQRTVADKDASGDLALHIVEETGRQDAGAVCPSKQTTACTLSIVVKVVGSLIILIIGGVIFSLIREFVGIGQYVFTAIEMLFLGFLWSKPADKIIRKASAVRPVVERNLEPEPCTTAETKQDGDASENCRQQRRTEESESAAGRDSRVEVFLPAFNSFCEMLLTSVTDQNGTAQPFDPLDLITAAAALTGMTYRLREKARCGAPALDDVNHFFEFVGALHACELRRHGHLTHLDRQTLEQELARICQMQRERMARYTHALNVVLGKGPGCSVGFDLAVEVQHDVNGTDCTDPFFATRLLTLVAECSFKP